MKKRFLAFLLVAAPALLVAAPGSRATTRL